MYKYPPKILNCISYLFTRNIKTTTMNSYSFVAFFAVLAVASASVAAVLPSTKIIQGPSSRSTVVGPDGSAISSIAPGGQIISEESVGVVAETAPVVAAAPALAYSAPLVAAHAAPAVAYSAPVVAAHTAYAAPVVAAHTAYSAPVVSAYSAPVVSTYSAPLVSGVATHSTVDTVVAGPSGTIATGRTVASPVVAAAPVVSAW
ncbi:cuticle protein 16.5-like [Euwallacea similis]|uniref:cuticle protein 16.5-like n=1 Tax=Euwallacea similis TaxID=1736056 RepID=UPI00344BCC3E